MVLAVSYIHCQTKIQDTACNVPGPRLKENAAQKKAQYGEFQVKEPGMTSHGALSCLFVPSDHQPAQFSRDGRARQRGTGWGLGVVGRGRGRTNPTCSVPVTGGSRASSQALVPPLCDDGRDAVLRPLVQRLQQDLGGGRGDAVHLLGLRVLRAQRSVADAIAHQGPVVRVRAAAGAGCKMAVEARADTLNILRGADGSIEGGERGGWGREAGWGGEGWGAKDGKERK